MIITQLETFFVKPRWLFLKIHTDEGICGWGEGYLVEALQIIDGHIEVADKPGLGIEVDERALANQLYDGSWDTPHLLHDDGSVGDW